MRITSVNCRKNGKTGEKPRLSRFPWSQAFSDWHRIWPKSCYKVTKAKHHAIHLGTSYEFFIKHFVNGFFNATAICDPVGNANNITDEIWNSQASAFHSLSDFAQATLINKTYTYGSTDGDSVGAAMERYDYIISKYGTSTFSDFIGRIEAGTRQDHYSFSTMDRFFERSFDVSQAVFIGAAIVVTGLFVTTFVIKKKKKN